MTGLTLNRPESLNALNQRMVEKLRDSFWGLVEDRQTRLVVTRGAGRAFCAGLDLKEHAMARTGRLESVPEALREQRKVSEIVMLIRRAPRFRDV